MRSRQAPAQSGITVRGYASAEELAAVIAVVGHGDLRGPVDPLSSWRAVRFAAVRRTTSTQL